jgi:hypothetical protein
MSDKPAKGKPQQECDKDEDKGESKGHEDKDRVEK